MKKDRTNTHVFRRSKGRRETTSTARDSTPPAPRLVTLGPVSAPLEFTGCDDVVDGLFSILRGWNPACAARARKAPLIRLKRTRNGYRRVSFWTRTPSSIREGTRGSATSAVCGIHYELIDWYAEEHPDQLCLHAAGMAFPKGIVLFPALAKAGKSVLSVELAARGVKIYGDDVVPIDLETRRAVALGIVPRLRPPLPRNASRLFREYVEAHAGLGRGDRLYIEASDREMVPYGATAPVKGIVLLERETSGRASIEAVGPEDALETLILQNFAKKPPADRVLDALHQIVRAATCRRLRYVKGEDAAALLLSTFGDPASASKTTARRRETARLS